MVDCHVLESKLEPPTLRLIGIDNPAGKALVDIAKVQDDEVEHGQQVWQWFEVNV